ncbi:MAG: hypothetical protein KAR21_16590 [Spirochaetales bacterium]|nr:hypothetical protein [Spirochaetales bacterium]
MNEILFLVEEDPEGGFSARAVQFPIFTEADTIDEIRVMILDSLRCHFSDEKDIPPIIRLHFIKEETLTYAPAS